MCFNKDLQKDTMHSISDEDIVCYKIVRGVRGDKNYFSQITHFPYHLGETYEENSISLYSLDAFNVLSYGVFHSYIKIHEYDLGVLALYNQKNDSLSTIQRSKLDYFILKCVIPAGTPYWVNHWEGEYASKAIKVIEALDPEKDFEKLGNDIAVGPNIS